VAFSRAGLGSAEICRGTQVEEPRGGRAMALNAVARPCATRRVGIAARGTLRAFSIPFLNGSILPNRSFPSQPCWQSATTQLTL